MLLIATDGRRDGGSVEEAARHHATPLCSVHSRRNLLYGPSGFPLGSRQEMSLARKEVIETVRDYKTSKHGRGCRPLKEAGVMAVAGIVWEPS